MSMPSAMRRSSPPPPCWGCRRCCWCGWRHGPPPGAALDWHAHGGENGLPGTFQKKPLLTELYKEFNTARAPATTMAVHEIAHYACPMSSQLLMIEDDARLAHMVSTYLAQSGLQVT